MWEGRLQLAVGAAADARPGGEAEVGGAVDRDAAVAPRLPAHPPHARRAVAALVLERNDLALGGEPTSRVLRVRVRGWG